MAGGALLGLIFRSIIPMEYPIFGGIGLAGLIIYKKHKK